MTDGLSGAKGRTLAFIAEIDGEELACRIAEASMDLRRPLGSTATEALDLADRSIPGQGQRWRAAAAAAASYVAECVGKGQRPA